MPGAHRKIEAHDNEGEHELVSNARPQKLVVHDIASHAILQPAGHAQTHDLAGSRSDAAPRFRQSCFEGSQVFRICPGYRQPYGTPASK